MVQMQNRRPHFLPERTNCCQDCGKLLHRSDVDSVINLRWVDPEPKILYDAAERQRWLPGHELAESEKSASCRQTKETLRSWFLSMVKGRYQGEDDWRAYDGREYLMLLIFPDGIEKLPGSARLMCARREVISRCLHPTAKNKSYINRMAWVS